MADIAETTTYPDAATAISQGKRHLLVQDYTAAVTALAEGLEMLSQKLGDCDDELGEPYLLYGRALLGLAREEVGVFGGGVPGSEEADEDDEVDEDEADEDKLSDLDEKDEEMETNELEDKKDDADIIETSIDKKNEQETKKEDTIEKTANKENEQKTKIEDNNEKTLNKENEPETKKEDTTEKTVNKENESENEKKDSQDSKTAEIKPATSNKTDDNKIEEQKLDENVEPEVSKKKEVESVAGTSKDPQTNGSVTEAKNCNGTTGKSSDEPEEDDDVNKEDDDDDPGRGIDLQVAWEVLELAKMVFVKRGEAGIKHLVETHKLLAEVAMESDNAHGAISDLKAALELLKNLEPCNPRAIAEIHYELGLAHSMENDFDASIKQFSEATTILEARINQLQNIKEPQKSDDPFYSVEGEIKELRELLPAIQEKISDMKDFKDEACKLVIAGINNQVAAVSNGAGTSKDDGASSSSQTSTSPKVIKPASDISHLVRKKRKADDNEDQGQSPCKKPTP